MTPTTDVPQLVDVLWERVTRDGPQPGTVTLEYNQLDAAMGAAVLEMLGPYYHRDLRASECDWLDELASEARDASLRAALAAMTAAIRANLEDAPEGLRATSERLYVDLQLPRDAELPEHLRPAR